MLKKFLTKYSMMLIINSRRYGRKQVWRTNEKAVERKK